VGSWRGGQSRECVFSQVSGRGWRCEREEITPRRPALTRVNVFISGDYVPKNSFPSPRKFAISEKRAALAGVILNQVL